ncbi:MAG: hypothetical protein M3Q58_07220 [Bacteroidota bacterium]|nr:hypothetical protein [Bacteroidota bacterium]
MKNIFYFCLALNLFLVSCTNEPARNHQELYDEHTSMVDTLKVLEDRYSSLLLEHEEFAATHREMFKDRLDTAYFDSAYFSLETKHKALMDKQAKIIYEHQQLLKEHSKLEKKHLEQSADEKTIQKEHKKIAQEHSRMLKEHEQMQKEHEQMKAEHQRLLQEHNSQQQ